MEFRFNCGNYRHFVVQADNEQQARERFEQASRMFPSPNCGYQLKDVTSIETIFMAKGTKVKWIDGLGFEHTGLVERDIGGGNEFMIPIRTYDDRILSIRYLDLHLVPTK